MSGKWDFLKEMTDIDDRFIKEAAEEWQPKKNIQQTVIKMAACLAIFISLTISCIAFNPQVRVMAENIKVKIGELMGSREDLTPYAQILNTTKTVAGVDVTLENVILDEDTLYVLMNVEDKRSTKSDEDQIDIQPDRNICMF